MLQRVGSTNTGTTQGRAPDHETSPGCLSHRADGLRHAAAPHLVHCPYCQAEFDLFSAPWCGHQGDEPSKICPRCDRCLCEHPVYTEPHFWKPAPLAFQKQGFQRLFLFYL